MGDDLKSRIAKAQAELDAQKRPSRIDGARGMGIGFRMASDFVAAVIVGLVLGWGIDALFHTSPWALIVCLMIGFATGVRNVVRQASAAQAEAQTQDQPNSAKPGMGSGKANDRTDEDSGA